MGNKLDIDYFEKLICISFNIYINFDHSQKHYREDDSMPYL